jgi:hypothetical protein
MLFMDDLRPTNENNNCLECGFDWNTEPGEVLAVLAGSPAALRKVTQPQSEDLIAEEFDRRFRARPSPSVWSVIEYLAHLRDALSFYRDRIELVLTSDRPELTTRDFAALAEASNYRNEEPTRVLATIESTLAETGARLRSLQREHWNRIGIGSSGEDRTVLTLARRMAHESQHHLLDLDRIRKQIS